MDENIFPMPINENDENTSPPFAIPVDYEDWPGSYTTMRINYLEKMDIGKILSNIKGAKKFYILNEYTIGISYDLEPPGVIQEIILKIRERLKNPDEDLEHQTCDIYESNTPWDGYLTISLIWEISF